MEITGIIAHTLKGYDKVEKTESSPRKAKGARSSPPAGRDSVNISGNARLASTATETARETPDVRKQKVAELKALVQSGQYEPDLQRTAAKIVEEDLDLLI